MPLTRRTLLQALAALLAAKPVAAAPATAPAALQPQVTLAIAGTSYHHLREVAHLLREGERLVLRREPLNPHDPNAIAIHAEGGAQLGYVPRRAAGGLAARLDRGEAMEARITGFLPTPDAGERFEIPEGLVRTWCHPGEPVVTLLA